MAPELGAFSISLTVADLDRSKTFYEALGFEVVSGAADENWLMLANGETLIGLFSGMFDKNVLTFNPGLTNRKEELDTFTDVREIQRRLEESGVELAQRVESDNESGPASIMLIDPDGNPILIDQFR